MTKLFIKVEVKIANMSLSNEQNKDKYIAKNLNFNYKT